MERARSQCSKESPAIVNDLQYDLEKVSMDTNADHLNSDTLEMDRERSLSITFLGDENGGGMPHSFSLPSNQQNSCFQNISAPGIAELLGSDGTQQKYFSASRREEELNSELIRSHEKIRQLEAKVKSLFHENERIKNELEVLRLSIVSDNNERSSSQQPRYWTAYEHKRFLDALQLFGEKNKKAISIYVGSRNVAQIRSHLQKYRLRMVGDSMEIDSRIERREMIQFLFTNIQHYLNQQKKGY